jgi:glucose-1-phosphate cytidylyltransferase
MKTVILCGGRGTRAYPHTVEIPKPLLLVGDDPILRHVMEIYAQQSYESFVLAAGFRHGLIEEFAQALPKSWKVRVLDTGEETNTGERVERCRDEVGDTFFLTYGDGLGNVDLDGLLEFHRSHKGTASVTVVPLPSQYGTIELDERGGVQNFNEKPIIRDHWINAGFFVFDRTVFDHWDGTDLERQVLPELSRRGELYAYRHDGFWKSMDTYKDAIELTSIFDHSKDRGPPWLSFEKHASS